jgi:hypothetical protein
MLKRFQMQARNEPTTDDPDFDSVHGDAFPRFRASKLGHYRKQDSIRRFAANAGD